MIDTEAIEKTCADVRRRMKTDSLIRALAESRYTWDQEDIDKAIRETDAEPFSLADVAFMAELNQSWGSRQQTMKEISEWMIENDLESRKEIFQKEFRPQLDEIKAYRRGIAAKYSGLVFYRNYLEEGENNVTAQP